MKVRANGKINLSLFITGTENKLHTLDSIMATVTAFDEVTVTPAPAISVTCDMGIAERENIAYRAAELVREQSGLSLAVDIKKGIPIGGGMGGSSADGAAVLHCASELLKGKMQLDTLRLAHRLGSDVAFMLVGGYCRVGGTGERITRLHGSQGFDALIVSCGEVSTPECYRAFDRLGEWSGRTATALAAQIEQGLKPSIDLINDLLPAARLLQPRIAEVERLITTAGSQPYLTGSGGCMFVLDPPLGLEEKLSGFECQHVSFAPQGIELVEN